MLNLLKIDSMLIILSILKSYNNKYILFINFKTEEEY